jgi:rRNA processing protein Krr1/Pno1
MARVLGKGKAILALLRRAFGGDVRLEVDDAKKHVRLLGERSEELLAAAEVVAEIANGEFPGAIRVETVRAAAREKRAANDLAERTQREPAEPTEPTEPTAATSGGEGVVSAIFGEGAVGSELVVVAETRPRLGFVIGAGGRTIKGLEARSGCRMKCDQGSKRVHVLGKTPADAERGAEMVRKLLRECDEKTSARG